MGYINVLAIYLLPAAQNDLEIGPSTLLWNMAYNKPTQHFKNTEAKDSG